MQEKIILFTFCVALILVFALNFNPNWTDKIFERVKNRKSTWYWLRAFKIDETKENYLKMIKALSLFVIVIMTLTIIILLTSADASLYLVP
jgi:hypothetical protein